MSADTAQADDVLWGQWMLQAQCGDRSAYHALLRAVTPYVRAIARRYVGPGEDAEDALQEVLLVVHRIRHTYEPGRPFKPWLATIASRRCIDLLRRRSHRQQHECGSDPDFDAATQVAGPDESLARVHVADRMRDAVGALPERQREAIRLLRLDELSLREASSQSRQSEGALKVACHRALKTLRRIVIDKGHLHD
ncbi:RNA polymerase sigma factor [Lysobacter sp. TAF61]|uniref:RNA polymerase sigma factor n=1 Tax=Lysobacter sp. TAF61 TaxID=3233072 RepID=UPI003F99BE20